MKYFALTEAVASWILGKAGLIDSLHQAIFDNVAGSLVPIGDEFIEGPFHIASSRRGDVVGFWHTDYLSGTGEEPWGFIRIDGELGLSNHLEMSREVFERCLYVISQRLQNLLIDGAFFPRSYPNGTHTCLAGRGSEARHLSLAYFETAVSAASQRQQALICVGPEQNWRVLEAAGEAAGHELAELVATANALLAPGRTTKVAAATVLDTVREFLKPFTQSDESRPIGNIEIATSGRDIDEVAKFNAVSLSFSDWAKPESTLTDVQRRILFSDAIDQHPIRIVGPGGSGKTLLMQLLVVRRARLAEERGENLRILYLVHNEAMQRMVRQRFEVLMCDRVLAPSDSVSIEVKTLNEIARELLELEDAHVIDTDAEGAKAFQYEEVRKALVSELQSSRDIVEGSRVLRAAVDNDSVLRVLAILIMSDISIAIKGQGLAKDRKKYVQSARSLSRFHGALSAAEREFVFRIFDRYNREVFENLEVLDSDDLAISLLGRLRTPIWELRRRSQGYDYVFVDETQLFNENERRIIPLLTNALKAHVPVVLSLDEAQSIYGLSSAGFAALGIEGMANESLASIHRSTKSIIELAFFVIQRSTDLFGADFPDFTNIADQIEPDSHPLAAKPRIDIVSDDKQTLGKFVLKRVRELRRSNIRQICVVVHADQYWAGILDAFRGSDLPLHVMLTRGERIPSDQPVVVLTRPAYVGGQEFDAVVLVGLEQGVVPPRMDSETLSITVEQQVLREIYLSVTRARYRVVIALSHGCAPTPIVADAAKHGLVDF